MRHPSSILATVLLLLFGFVHTVVAQGEEAFAGEWRNRAQGGSIVGANIYKENGRWMVQLLGSCTPTPCVWNAEPLSVLEARGRAAGPPRGIATVQQANLRRIMTFRLGEETLVVEVYSMTTPVASQGAAGPRYFSVDELTRTKRTAGPLPSTRPPTR